MILLDLHEPAQIEELIAQSLPVSRMGLNPEYADYMWFAIDNHRIQVERKQIDEILSDMDGVEEQLRRELQSGVEETILLYEGTFEPIYEGRSTRAVESLSELLPELLPAKPYHPTRARMVQSWKKAKGKQIMVPSRKYSISYSGVQAWFNQLDKAGVTIVHTFDYIATAITLVALYNNSQKAEHTTLRRYIKDRIYPMPNNPHIQTLMGIKGANLGEAKATALIERYGTVWYTLNQDAEDIAETLVVDKQDKQIRLGLVVAKKLLQAVGRN